MVSRAGGLVALDRPRPGARPRNGLSRRVLVGGTLVGAGVLMALAAIPGHSSPRTLLASGRPGLSSLPLAAQTAVSRGLGSDQGAFFARHTASGAVSLNNAPQGLRATLSSGGIVLSGAHGLRLELSALAIGRSGALRAVSGLTSASVDRNRVAYSSARVSEWFANGPLGVEQGFTLAHRPAGSGALSIAQTIGGSATGRVDTATGGVTFASSAGSLSYARLAVTDAAGARVPARLGIAGRRLTITIQDQHAAYPLRIDPTIQQVAELTASDGGAYDNAGQSVAVSGSTIAVGAPEHNGQEGAVYVYTQPAAGGWANATQTAELAVSDPGGTDEVGYAVSIVGSTIVAGAPQHTGSSLQQGAIYVWTMPVGGWSGTPANPLTQTAELNASDGTSYANLGVSVALSGTTIVAGAIGQGVGGAVYVWTMPAGGWSGTPANPLYQTAELAASDVGANDQLGFSVGISGSTIVAGSPGHFVFQGAAYEWTMPAGGWAGTPGNPLAQTAELAPSDGASDDLFGESVAVSGSTIVAGSPQHTVGSNGFQGAVYEYTMPAGGWAGTPGNPMAQTAELTASDGGSNDELGTSVAISGSTIVGGAPQHAVTTAGQQGAVYVYTMPAGGWVGTPASPLTQGAELTASDGVAAPGGMQPGDNFGDSVALAGATIAVGARDHTGNGNVYQGAAYAFHPVVTSQTVSLALSPPTITANGTSTSTATFTADDTSGAPVSGDAVSITSSGSQQIGPVTAGAAPGTYQATITSTTIAGTATITAADTSVAADATASAVLSQTPTPADGMPSNAFTIDGYSHRENGSITLTLSLPGPGAVNVLGTHSDPADRASSASALLAPGHRRLAWARHSASADRAGRMRISLSPNAAGKRMLRYARHEHWALHIRVWITYTPTGGHARTAPITVRVLAARHA